MSLSLDPAVVATRDRELVQIVDAALADAARRAGSWLVCRPGCTQCCLGPFAITPLDAMRLRRGFAELAARDPERAARVADRARQVAERMAPDYPGDSQTGILDDPDVLPEGFDEEPCPALDPATGRCDLYTSRPMTCRTFGPPTSTGGGRIGICELCFVGASEDDISGCLVEFDPTGLEAAILDRLDEEGVRGDTLVAFAIASA